MKCASAAVNLRQAQPEDADFLYHLLKAAMQGYVTQTYGWDEGWQQAHFQQTFDPAKQQVIVLDRRDIGVIAVERKDTEFFLAKLYLLPAYQNRGIGTQLIQALLQEAFSHCQRVTLRVLKVNPARRLYERLGFKVVEETDTHYLMEARSPGY